MEEQSMGEATELPGRLLLNDMARMFRNAERGKFSSTNTQEQDRLLAKEATFYRALCAEAQPFLMPHNGDLGLEGKRSIMMGELRPPYPVTALEFKFTNEFAKAKNFSAATIFLMDDWDNDNDFCISMAACWLELTGTWGWCDEILRVPKGLDLQVTGFDECTFSGPVQRAPLGITDEDPKFRPCWAFFTRIAADFLCLLSCSNVDVRDAPISRFKREQDARKHRGRFLVYKILDLPNKTASGEDVAVGTHASPRFHFRRGHIRRLPTGKNCWVRMHSVGTMVNGIVAKDYRVTSQSDRGTAK
jgi:hypothetical protein